MRIGDLFKGRERQMYPTVDDILKRELASARHSFPNMINASDAVVLALSAATLRKNLAERTSEKDQYSARLGLRCPFAMKDMAGAQAMMLGGR